MSALNDLGLPADATADDVRRRWRKLAREHHPDAGGNPATFTAYRRLYVAALDEIRARPCPDCRGAGTVAEAGGFCVAQLPCSRCRGTGLLDPEN
jgi:DnaJ-class molecular chaperone